MEVKKCQKCGAFIMSESDLCASCAKEQAYANTVLKTYFDENVSFDSIPSISAITGVAPELIQSYMKENHYIDTEMNSITSFNHIQY